MDRSRSSMHLWLTSAGNSDSTRRRRRRVCISSPSLSRGARFATTRATTTRSAGSKVTVIGRGERNAMHCYNMYIYMHMGIWGSGSGRARAYWEPLQRARSHSAPTFTLGLEFGKVRDCRSRFALCECDSDVIAPLCNYTCNSTVAPFSNFFCQRL